MPSLASFAILCFGSLLSIVDPFAAVPVFLALTGDEAAPRRRQTALRASLTCFLVLTAFALAGTLIFQFFGITIPAFKIAGGLILFLVGLDMMRAKASETRGTVEERHEARSREDVGIIPLGVPLLSGPGAIATSMVLAGKARTVGEKAAVHAAIFAVAVLTFGVLGSASVMSRLLGRTGMNVIGRVMGLILAAVAMQFVLDGLREWWLLLPPHG